MAIGTPVDIGTNSSAAAATTVTTTGAVPAGALVIMIAGTGMSSGTSTITASGGGLTWAAADISNLFSGAIPWYMSIFAAQAPSGLSSSTALTATASGTFLANMVAIVYCTGLATSSPKDVAAGSGAATTAWTTGSATTTVADTLIIGGCIHDGTTTNTASGGATEIHDFQFATEAWSMCTEYKILAATANTSLTGTWLTGANDYDAAFVAYKGAVSASTTTAAGIVVPNWSVMRPTGWW